jgi:uncharacterized membrane-anchored protein
MTRKPITLPRLSLPVLAVGLGMIGFLGLMVSQHTLALRASETITIPAQGYDPRDLLAGHYAELRTELHRIPADRVAGEVHAGDRVWVVIEPEGEGWQVVSAAKGKRPPVAGGQFALKADVIWSSQAGSGQELSVTYGIERWFAAQEDALEIERLARRTDDEAMIDLIVAIGPDGQARLTGLEIGDRRQMFSWW